MDLLEVFTKSITGRRRASMSDYEEAKTMVNAAAQLANAAKAEMARVEAQEELGKTSNEKRKKKNNVKIYKGMTVDLVTNVPQIEITGVDGMRLFRLSMHSPCPY